MCNLTYDLINELTVFSYNRLRALAAEVTRVTLEVGSQGKLGGQAHVPDVEGVWYELVRNVSRPMTAHQCHTYQCPGQPTGESNVLIPHRSSPIYSERHNGRSQRRLDPKN